MYAFRYWCVSSLSWYISEDFSCVEVNKPSARSILDCHSNIHFIKSYIATKSWTPMIAHIKILTTLSQLHFRLVCVSLDYRPIRCRCIVQSQNECMIIDPKHAVCQNTKCSNQFTKKEMFNLKRNSYDESITQPLPAHILWICIAQSEGNHHHLSHKEMVLIQHTFPSYSEYKFGRARSFPQMRRNNIKPRQHDDTSHVVRQNSCVNHRPRKLWSYLPFGKLFLFLSMTGSYVSSSMSQSSTGPLGA